MDDDTDGEEETASDKPFEEKGDDNDADSLSFKALQRVAGDADGGDEAVIEPNIFLQSKALPTQVACDDEGDSDASLLNLLKTTVE